MTTAPFAPVRTPSGALMALGALCVVLGGLVAAVTGPLDLTKGSWAAAFLVLVLGVAQYAMGWVRGAGTGTGPDGPGWTQLATWNLGGAAVIAGTVAGSVLGVGVGSVLLVVALALALRADLRGSGRGRAVALAYRGLLLVLLVSIPVGMVLAQLRNG